MFYPIADYLLLTEHINVFIYSARIQQKSSWASLGPSQLDSSLLNNIQKLFSERIDLSGTVEPNKGSIVMAIIKICLKVYIFWLQF